MKIPFTNDKLPTMINGCSDDAQARVAQCHASLIVDLRFNPENVSIEDAQNAARQLLREALYGDIARHLLDVGLLLRTEGRLADGLAALDSLQNSVVLMLTNGVPLPVGAAPCDGPKSSESAESVPTDNTSAVPSGAESKTESEPSKADAAPADAEQSNSTTESTPSA